MLQPLFISTVLHILLTNIYQNVVSLKACMCYLLSVFSTGYMCVGVCVCAHTVQYIHELDAFAQQPSTSAIMSTFVVKRF